MKGVPVNVRLEPQIEARLEEVAAASGLDKSTLIRIAVASLLKEVQETGGKIVIPLTFKKPPK